MVRRQSDHVSHWVIGVEPRLGLQGLIVGVVKSDWIPITLATCMRQHRYHEEQVGRKQGANMKEQLWQDVTIAAASLHLACPNQCPAASQYPSDHAGRRTAGPVTSLIIYTVLTRPLLHVLCCCQSALGNRHPVAHQQCSGHRLTHLVCARQTGSPYPSHLAPYQQSWP